MPQIFAPHPSHPSSSETANRSFLYLDGGMETLPVPMITTSKINSKPNKSEISNYKTVFSE